jgi:predicted alpha/beta-fold hydrolase
VREVVDYVSAKYPDADLYATGFSVGGNQLAKMCGIDGESCKLKAAYCCQPPMKYWETSKNLELNWYGLMDYITGLKIYNLHINYIDYFEPIYRKLYGIEAR